MCSFVGFLLPIFSRWNKCRKELEDGASQPEVHPNGSDETVSTQYLVAQVSLV